MKDTRNTQYEYANVQLSCPEELFKKLNLSDEQLERLRKDRIFEIANLPHESLVNEDFRAEARKEFTRSIQSESPWLPSMSILAKDDAIDQGVFLDLDKSMTSEEKRAFLTSILNCENIQQNIFFLIENSDFEVMKFLTLQIGFTYLRRNRYVRNYLEVCEVPNIYLYTLANMVLTTEKKILFIDVLEEIKNALMIYDPKIIAPITNKLPPIELPTREQLGFERIMNSLKLRTDTQLEMNTDNFFKKMEQIEEDKLKIKKIDDEEVSNIKEEAFSKIDQIGKESFKKTCLKRAAFLSINLTIQALLVSFIGLPIPGGIIKKILTQIFDNS